MNGYETMSENYKILMQRGEIEKEAAEKAISCVYADLRELISEMELRKAA